MEEQGGETKYPRLQYDGSHGSLSRQNISSISEFSRMMQEPPEGFRFMYNKIQTETGEKLVPITMGGFPILEVKPGYRKINKPRTSDLPLELMRYLYPDYDPSDPFGPVSTLCPDIPQPCVFLNEAHKKRVLDMQAAAIQEKADLKRRQEKALEEFNRNYAANLSAPTAASSGTKADQNLGELSSTMV